LLRRLGRLLELEEVLGKSASFEVDADTFAGAGLAGRVLHGQLPPVHPRSGRARWDAEREAERLEHGLEVVLPHDERA